MAELATVARPYAQALFATEAATASSQWLEELALFTSSRQMQAFASNPKVQDSQLVDLLMGMIKSPVPSIARNFLSAVVGAGRLNVLPEIVKQFHKLQNAQKGTADALVRSAFAIEEKELSQLKQVLEQKFNRALNLKLEIDPGLIGGVCVTVGDEVLDTSVRAKLEQMKVALAS